MGSLHPMPGGVVSTARVWLAKHGLEADKVAGALVAAGFRRDPNAAGLRERVEAIHHPVNVYEMPDGGAGALLEQIVAGTATHWMTVCAGCASQRVLGEIEDGELDEMDGDALAAAYPCPTIAALVEPTPGSGK